MREVNIPVAVRLYYSKLSLSNKDIKAIFSIKADSTAVEIKKEVVKYWAKQAEGINPVNHNNRLDTERAFVAWGLDIENLERRLKKLQKLKMLNDEENNITLCGFAGVEL